MIALSLGEAEALLRKAARGAGRSWGMAEECGRTHGQRADERQDQVAEEVRAVDREPGRDPLIEPAPVWRALDLFSRPEGSLDGAGVGDGEREVGVGDRHERCRDPGGERAVQVVAAREAERQVGAASRVRLGLDLVIVQVDQAGKAERTASVQHASSGTSVETIRLENATDGRVIHSTAAHMPVRASRNACPNAYNPMAVAACSSGDEARTQTSASPQAAVVAAMTQAISGGLVK